MKSFFKYIWGNMFKIAFVLASIACMGFTAYILAGITKQNLTINGAKIGQTQLVQEILQATENGGLYPIPILNPDKSKTIYKLKRAEE